MNKSDNVKIGLINLNHIKGAIMEELTKKCEHEDLQLNTDIIICTGCGRIWNLRTTKLFYSPCDEVDNHD
jgi:hypothetical protein